MESSREQDETIRLKSIEVESRFGTDLTRKFPYGDCYKLQKQRPAVARSLVPNLDFFFSFIAGYSSSATRLAERPVSELRTALPKLKLSFFDMFPSYSPLRDLINPIDTKELYDDLRVADELRRSLVEIMEVITKQHGKKL